MGDFFEQIDKIIDNLEEVTLNEVRNENIDSILLRLKKVEDLIKNYEKFLPDGVSSIELIKLKQRLPKIENLQFRIKNLKKITMYW